MVTIMQDIRSIFYTHQSVYTCPIKYFSLKAQKTVDFRCHTSFSFFIFRYPGQNMARPDIWPLKK